jgi:hypothetical protein
VVIELMESRGAIFTVEHGGSEAAGDGEGDASAEDGGSVAGDNTNGGAGDGWASGLGNAASAAAIKSANISVPSDLRIGSHSCRCDESAGDER